MSSFETIAVNKLSKLELNEPGAQNIWKLTTSIMVDTSAALKSLVNTLMSPNKSCGSIYMDLEGVNLSRHGSISLIQILVPSCEQAFIVDIHTLGKTAFDTLGSEGKSLKDALESETIKKYLFDVRNDSDALYALFGVRLVGVVDIQLQELATREGDKHIVRGLAKCMEQEQALPLLALSQWQSTKREVVKMFDPKLGGTFEVFNARPLPQILVDYCVGDVEFLPRLSAIYESRMNRRWSKKVRIETEKRLEESKSLNYEHRGRKKIFGPKSWRFPPKGGKKSTAPAPAPASKKGKKPVAMVTASAPKEGEKPNAVVSASAPKEGKKSTAKVAAPAPKKGKRPTTIVSASAPKEEKKSTAKVASSAPKIMEKANATVVASAAGVPVSFVNPSQGTLIQPEVCATRLYLNIVLC